MCGRSLFKMKSNMHCNGIPLQLCPHLTTKAINEIFAKTHAPHT